MFMDVSRFLRSADSFNAAQPSSFFRLILPFSLGTVFGVVLASVLFTKVAGSGSEFIEAVFSNQAATRTTLADALSALQSGDYAKALEIAKPLADDGNVQAQTLLARMYAQGNSVLNNYPAAYHWYKKAAERGDPEAQFALAELYAYGYGVERNPARAAQWSSRAYQAGYGKQEKTTE